METRQSTEGKWSHGNTIPVRNVQALAENSAELTAEDIKQYIRPEMINDRVSHGDRNTESIPVIDLGKLLHYQSSQLETARLKSACEEWGFFQVENHGIPYTVLENMRNNMEYFFRLPLNKKNEFCQLPGDLQGYGHAFVESEHQTLDWSDRLYLVTQPPHDRDMRPWPTTPVNFRESIESYSSEVMRVTCTLMEIIAKNLGTDLEQIGDTFVSQALRMAYYPACPVAHDNVLGFSPHSDISTLTLVWELNMVEGLQIKRKGVWVPVEPRSKALVVNVGDFLEIVITKTRYSHSNDALLTKRTGYLYILTNGKYQSIEHRVTVNPLKERMSISAFHLPKFDMSVGPLSDIVGRDTKKYKTLRVDEVAKLVFSNKLDGKKTKEYAMLSI